MSADQTLVVVAVISWAVWLLWSGRRSSPRRRADRARWQYLMDEAIRDKDQR